MRRARAQALAARGAAGTRLRAPPCPGAGEFWARAASPAAPPWGRAPVLQPWPALTPAWRWGSAPFPGAAAPRPLKPSIWLQSQCPCMLGSVLLGNSPGVPVPTVPHRAPRRTCELRASNPAFVVALSRGAAAGPCAALAAAAAAPLCGRFLPLPKPCAGRARPLLRWGPRPAVPHPPPIARHPSHRAPQMSRANKHSIPGLAPGLVRHQEARGVPRYPLEEPPPAHGGRRALRVTGAGAPGREGPAPLGGLASLRRSNVSVHGWRRGQGGSVTRAATLAPGADLPLSRLTFGAPWRPPAVGFGRFM
jgi:hypothetical protein